MLLILLKQREFKIQVLEAGTESEVRHHYSYSQMRSYIVFSRTHRHLPGHSILAAEEPQLVSFYLLTATQHLLSHPLQFILCVQFHCKLRTRQQKLFFSGVQGSMCSYFLKQILYQSLMGFLFSLFLLYFSGL